VLVIGAGIQGAGVAQAAAAAGYRVAILEQRHVAAATSSRSSKLIHGGLRYLESGQFALVRKSLQERARLLRLAPQLVHLVPFYLPVYAGMRRGPGLIRLGLMLYSLLGGLRSENRFRSLPRKEWRKLGLRTDGLRAVFRYFDGQTDDAALTRAVVDSACALGAELLCPATFLAAQVDADGVDAEIEHDGRRRKLRGRVLINATGPWVDRVQARIQPVVPGPAIDLVQGSHILLDAPAPPGIVYVEAPQDGRAVFIMPWRGQTLVGTTETLYQGDPAAVAPLPEEIAYLQAVYAHYYPGQNPRVLDSFAGLRVLPRQGRSLFNRPRDTLLHVGPERVLALYGGKLTAYRATAEEVMQRIRDWLPPARPIADTRRLALKGRGTSDEETRNKT
jgi:glycerol-3-phosphate dehydrogenase